MRHQLIGAGLTSIPISLFVSECATAVWASTLPFDARTSNKDVNEESLQLLRPEVLERFAQLFASLRYKELRFLLSQLSFKKTQQL